MVQSLAELEDSVSCDDVAVRLEMVENGTPSANALTDAHLLHLEDCPDCRVALIRAEGTPKFQ